jgi:hypothetical protein
MLNHAPISRQRQPANFTIRPRRTILKRTMGAYPDPRRSSTTTTAVSADTSVRDLFSCDLVKHFLWYVAIHHIPRSTAYGVCRTAIWRKGRGRKLECIRLHIKRSSRLLSRVNVISVCQLSVAKTGSTFLASSSKLGDDTACIMRLMSSFTKMTRKFQRKITYHNKRIKRHT